MAERRILISGAGIAGLTLAIALKERDFAPVVIEREPGPRREGYMMDFFGTGWDVAERMCLIEELRAVRYPIDTLEFVDAQDTPYMRMPIERMRRTLGDKYVYLRRQDLERILLERAHSLAIAPRYGMSLAALDGRGKGVRARFEDGSEEEFSLVVGADGVHSRVRELMFGEERQFARFLGLHVAAFHVARPDFPVTRAVRIYEEPDRMVMLYALDKDHVDATFIIRRGDDGHVPHAERFTALREAMRGAGWVTQALLEAHDADEPVFFDSVTQIVMPQWHTGRVALIGDACGCLTLLAGQGSQMAMAGGYVLANELARHAEHTAAFVAYERALKNAVTSRQKSAARFAPLFVPKRNSWPWLRRLTIKAIFARPVIDLVLLSFGSRSALAGYR